MWSKRMMRIGLFLFVALLGLGAQPLVPVWADPMPYAGGDAPASQASSWSFEAVELSSHAVALGKSVTVKPVMTGELDPGVQYNYVWAHQGQFDDWSSTVKETGERTAEPTWCFTPRRAGWYELFVDVVAPDGTVVTKQTRLEVFDGWRASSLELSSEGDAFEASVPWGQEIEMRLVLEPGSDGAELLYNFGWRFGDTWDEWDSLSRRGEEQEGAVWSFTPSKAGRYYLFADVIAPDGRRETLDTTIEVDKGWNLERLDLSYETPLYPGGGVYGTAVVSGDTSGLKYNFVWERDGWADWNSNVRAGSYASSPTMSWAPITVPGTYSFAVDVVDGRGEQQTVTVGGIVVGSPVRDRMTSMAQGYGSHTSWLIMIDTTNNYLGIFRGGRGAWNLDRYWICSTGAAATPTVLGEYTVKAKGYSFGHGYTCYYYTQFFGDYLIHSVKYYQGTFNVLDGRMGMNISEGCIRLPIDQAKWIWDNVPTGTKVVTYR